MTTFASDLATRDIPAPSQQDHAYLARLGLRLRVLRVERELTQDQLADRAGLNRTYVSRLERGHHNVTVLILGRLARRSVSTAGSCCHERST